MGNLSELQNPMRPLRRHQPEHAQPVAVGTEANENDLPAALRHAIAVQFPNRVFFNSDQIQVSRTRCDKHNIFVHYVTHSLFHQSNRRWKNFSRRRVRETRLGCGLQNRYTVLLTNSAATVQ